jgi:hypothetical protein
MPDRGGQIPKKKLKRKGTGELEKENRSMSILINMEMPKNCMLCNFCVEEADPANGEMCLVTGRLMPPCNHERLDDCPLIEVPPHGNLIDADAINHEDEIWKKKCIPQQVVYNAWVVAGEMPTVIPADKDGET